MSNFALTGLAGYIAPKHVKAIRDTGNALIAALDPHDSVGILEQWYPDCSFFTEFERFDRHAEKLRRAGEESRLHYVSICSPNYLHDAQIRFALRIGADAICEKPLVLNPWNLDALQLFEEETGNRIYTVLQLRHHPSFVKLKESLMKEVSGKRHQVTVTYITSRGKWYDHSWKGKPEKSGGLALNIGIHFFDLLIWLFGGVQRLEVHSSDSDRVSGALELESADVTWFLSKAREDLSKVQVPVPSHTYRSIVVDNEEVEFSDAFSDLHLSVYQSILAGNGAGIEDARPSLQLGYQIRSGNPIGIQDYSHEFIRT